MLVRILAAISLAVAPAIAQESHRIKPAEAGQSQRLTALGAYSNFRFTEEHQYGAEVQLWRDGTAVIGLFSYADGLAGDTPAGTLEKVSFDPGTGRLAFSTRLTTGVHFCLVHHNVPSRDLFVFSGILEGTSVSGTLTRVDSLHPDRAPTTEHVVLTKTDGGTVGQYETREQWDAAMKEVLKFRGPKW
jgi:hypothetical protein